MAQSDLDQALDLSGLQSSRQAQSLAADFTSMKESIDSTFSPQQASVLNYTLGMGVGVLTTISIPLGKLLIRL